MEKTQFVATLCCLFILAAPMAFAGEQSWTFDNNTDDWTVANGTWEVNGGIYQETSGADAAMHSLVGNVNWTDYTVEAKVRIDGGGQWAGIVFRAQSEFEYYVYYLNSTDNKSELWRHKAGGFDARDAINNNIAPVGGISVVNDEWINVVVDAQGNTFQLWINGQQQAEVTDDAYPSGQIGVWTWQSTASFDDIKISGDGIAGNATAVEPQNKLAITWARIRQR